MIGTPPVNAPNPLDEIESRGLSIREIADSNRLLSSVFGDEIFTASEVAVEALDTAAVATVIALGGELVAAIVIIIIIVCFVVLLLVHNTIHKTLANIPVAGPALAGIDDFVWQVFDGVKTWIWNEAVSVLQGLAHKIWEFITLLIAAYGLPSLDYVHGQLAQAQAALSRLPYDIDALANRVAHALAQAVTSIWNNIHQIWHWIHVILYDINLIWNNFHHVWNWIHHILAELESLAHLAQWLLHSVTTLISEVQYLLPEVQHLSHSVETLQKEVQMLQNRVLHDESLLSPAIETTAVLALLLPLLDNGPRGIESLVETQIDPCRCFFIPGTRAWLLNALVMYLWWRDGP